MCQNHVVCNLSGGSDSVSQEWNWKCEVHLLKEIHLFKYDLFEKAELRQNVII